MLRFRDDVFTIRDYFSSITKSDFMAIIDKTPGSLFTKKKHLQREVGHLCKYFRLVYLAMLVFDVNYNFFNLWHIFCAIRPICGILQ